jgi:mono/diheme cytochrome c family protein
MNRLLLIAGPAAAAAIVGLIVWQMQEKPVPPPPAASATSIQLTAAQEGGRQAFEARCAACHGAFGAGTDKGPPLTHKIYQPSHHPDQAFELAAKYGTRAHHWKFGDMPPVAGITAVEIPLIIDFIRAVQRANGIN